VLYGSFQPLLRLPYHSHKRACVTIVLRGRFTERVQGKDRLCSVATVLAKPAGERHDDEFGQDGSGQVIIEPDPTAAEALSPCTGLLDEVWHFTDASVQSLGERLSAELDNPDDVTPLAAEALVLEIIGRVTRTFRVKAMKGVPPRWLSRAREMLEDRFAERISAVEIAAELGTHPAYLARLFTHFYGMPIGDYVRQLRIQSAAAQLAGETKSLARIAIETGFYDQSHFTRAFKLQMGLTPHQYRLAHGRRHRHAS
jgi:AraC family transcriptional regulator